MLESVSHSMQNTFNFFLREFLFIYLDIYFLPSSQRVIVLDIVVSKNEDAPLLHSIVSQQLIKINVYQLFTWTYYQMDSAYRLFNIGWDGTRHRRKSWERF